ncbi:hypothetical protein HZA42_01440 [Candidatus Peregrinibacteria bacterium]|nr:hypothetical protein [Candidatus Peregrinibacteria bacterium]
MWGIAGSFLVGLICVLPQIFFIFSLGSEYHGIHFFATPNEEVYLAIMQKISEGHLLAASFPFYEYKNNLPLLPPTIPLLYVFVSRLLHISLVNTLIVSKFFLPAILFFLVYLFTHQLLVFDTKNTRLSKLVAVTTGTLVTLGFDLVDYHSIWKILTGKFSITGFLIWTRPVNPISGIILLYVFLLSLWMLITKRKKINILIAAVTLAFMMASYFFSWSIALTIIGILGLRALFSRDFKLAKYFGLVVILALFFSSPYWFMVWRASHIPWYAEASARIGLFMTHTPHVNKFLFAVSIFFTFSSVIYYMRNKVYKSFPEWWWFCFSLLLSSFIVYNQQILTGREIWYYHYVFFTIPLGYTVIILTLWYFVKPKKQLMYVIVIFLFVAAFSLGIYTQVSAYKTRFNFFASLQKFSPVFDFLNKSMFGNCVVLSIDSDGFWDELIPAFTHCDTYISGERTSVIAPPERFYHNYMVLLRLRGVTVEGIEDYLKLHHAEAEGYLYYQLQYTLGYHDVRLNSLLARLPNDYKIFLKNDFYQELKKYRVDYLLSDGPLMSSVVKSLPPLKKVFSAHNIDIFVFQ